MGKVTSYGYERKTLSDILTSMKSNLRSKLGNDWNVETGSIEDQFISVFAEELDQAEQGVEGVVAAQTIEGAEGVFLDDVLSQRGVFRKGKTAGGGASILFTKAANGLNITLNKDLYTVSALNNVQYKFESDVNIEQFMSCYKLPASTLQIGTEYRFQCYNTNNSKSTQFVWQVISDSDKDNMLQALVVFFNDNIADQPSPTYYHVGTRTLYCGFNQNTNLPNPFPEGTLFVSSIPYTGIIGTKVYLKAQTLGYRPLSTSGLVNVSPVYTGYDSIVNYTDLNSGTEVQTDVEYLYSASSIENDSIAGTPNSLKGALLEIEGVIDAEVFENPTSNYIYDVSNNKVCDPFKYHIVVLGGEDLDIAQAIYDKAYGNTQQNGNTVVNARNYKDQSVAVRFTRAGRFNIAVDIKYKTKDGTPLNDTEKTTIAKKLQEVVDSFAIGDVVSVNMLEAITYQAASFSRLKQVVLTIKDMTASGSSFTSQDLTADFYEKPRLEVSNVTFGRI